MNLNLNHLPALAQGSPSEVKSLPSPQGLGEVNTSPLFAGIKPREPLMTDKVEFGGCCGK